MTEHLKRSELALLVLGVVVTFFLVRSTPAFIVLSGDSQESLVTTQAILQQGTIRLDAYYPQDRPDTVFEANGHLYYFFPLGTPLLSAPFVGLALLFGGDMLVEADNFALQKTLAALTVSLSLVLIYLICRRFVGYGLSWVFTMVFVFGSAIISTMGTALFNVNFAFLFMLIVLLLLVHDSQGQPVRFTPYLLGGALFMAYLCRPTSLALTITVFAYVLLVRRPWFLRMAATFALLFGLLALFSWREFGQVLPSYYLPSRLSNASNFWTALYGNLASPGRGLLVYSPFLLATVAGLLLVIKRIWREPLLWLALVWIGLHLVSVSRLAFWWGGWSFGSRFMAETLAAWLLITLLVWRELKDTQSRRVYLGLTAAFVALGVAAIAINSIQGLLRPATYDWNRWHRPLAANEYPQSVLMLDWKYPQFLASHERLDARDAEYRLAESLQPLALGEAIGVESEAVLFDGWTNVETDGAALWRRSDGPTAKILFRVDPALAEGSRAPALQLAASVDLPQQVTVLLNGKTIGTIAAPGDGAISQHMFPFPSSLLNPSVGRRYNTLEFLITGAVDPGNQDRRTRGLAVQELQWVADD